MVLDVVKPGLRPNSSQEYYEAWSRLDSGISLMQVMKPRERPDSSIKHREAWIRPDNGSSLSYEARIRPDNSLIPSQS